MRLLVCGGRDYADFNAVMDTLDVIHGHTPISVLIEGGAIGADRLARRWAKERGVPFETYEAKWSMFGKTAGALRNWEMLEKGKPDRVLAFPGGKGTAHMKRIAQERGVPLTEV